MITPELKKINIKGKLYATVNTRISAFHVMYPNGRIQTEILGDPKEHVFIKAKVTPNVEFPERYFDGHSQAKWVGNINAMAALENAETSAVGRALGFLNIGIEDGVCSAEELNKATPPAKAKDMFAPSTPSSSPKGDGFNLADITERLELFCEEEKVTDADLYKFARGLTEESCKKLGIDYPAVPTKGDEKDKPFIGVADTALMNAIVVHSKLVLNRIKA